MGRKLYYKRLNTPTSVFLVFFILKTMLDGSLYYFTKCVTFIGAIAGAGGNKFIHEIK